MFSISVYALSQPPGLSGSSLPSTLIGSIITNYCAFFFFSPAKGKSVSSAPWWLCYAMSGDRQTDCVCVCVLALRTARKICQRLLPDQVIYTDPKNGKETLCDIPNPAVIIGLFASGGFQWDMDCLRYLPSDAPISTEYWQTYWNTRSNSYRFRGSSLLPPNPVRFKSELGSNMHG